jgi:hypothetical protein
MTWAESSLEEQTSRASNASAKRTPKRTRDAIVDMFQFLKE